MKKSEEMLLRTVTVEHDSSVGLWLVRLWLAELWLVGLWLVGSGW